MANRPVFCTDAQKYVRRVDMEFEYYSGFAKSQRQKCVKSLHKAFLNRYPDAKILEISSFSENPLGVKLSAFHLPISLQDGSKVPVETAFQGGKVFERGGPYKDLLTVSPGNAKKDRRLKESGHVIGFNFEDREFPIKPYTLFYTWLYIHALNENKELADQILLFDAFTDIVFNPEKSKNCQACAAAVYVSLCKKGELDKALGDLDFLAKIVSADASVSHMRIPVEVDKSKRETVKKNTITIFEQKNAIEEFSSIFHKNDTIIHPVYGKGTVVNIHMLPKRADLTVSFEGVGEKKLDENWVRLRCKFNVSGNGAEGTL